MKNHFDFKKTQKEFMTITQSHSCRNLDIASLREKWTEIEI